MLLKLIICLFLVPTLVYNCEMNWKNIINGQKFHLPPIKENRDDTKEKQKHQLGVDRRLKSKNWQILNGEVGKIKEFPYMASIFYMDEQTNVTFVCAGNIISEFHILTAAHCAVSYSDAYQLFTPLDPKYFGVTVGSSYWSVGGQNLEVSEVHIHPDHNKVGTLGRDMSVLKTTEKILTNSNVAVMPVAGPDETHYLENMEDSKLTCVVAGWGSTEYEGDVSEILRYVRLPLMPIETCIELGKRTRFHITKQLHICTYLKNKDSCSGDSGSGLVCKTPDGVNRIWGTVSFACRCGEELKPGYYARLDNAYSFLEPFLPSKTGKKEVSRSVGLFENDFYKHSIHFGFQIIVVPVLKKLLFSLGY